MQTHTSSDQKIFSLKSQQFQKVEDLWTSKASNLEVMLLVVEEASVEVAVVSVEATEVASVEAVVVSVEVTEVASVEAAVVSVAVVVSEVSLFN